MAQSRKVENARKRRTSDDLISMAHSQLAVGPTDVIEALTNSKEFRVIPASTGCTI